MQQKGILWLLAGALLFCLSACSDFSRLQKKGTDDEKYKAAQKYYEKKDWYRAGLLFEELIPKLKGSAEQELSQYYYANTQYEQRLYEISAQLYKRFYETFARSEYAQEAMYKYALSLFKGTPSFNLDQSNTVTAMASLQDFINAYPDTPFKDECNKMIAELRHRLERKAYERAKQYYKVSGFSIANYKSSVVSINNFQREFPDSEYNEELAYLKVDAQYNLAKNSLDTKQKERYQETIAYKQQLAERYPNSRYLKDAEKMVETSKRELERIMLAEKEREKTKAKPDSAAPAKVGSGQ